jgi:hypothetical protein
MAPGQICGPHCFLILDAAPRQAVEDQPVTLNIAQHIQGHAGQADARRTEDDQSS